jgi:hypothetical protein
MTGDGAKVSAAEMELTPVAIAEKEPLNPGDNLLKPFYLSLMLRANKLECLSLSSRFAYQSETPLRVGSWPCLQIYV